MQFYPPPGERPRGFPLVFAPPPAVSPDELHPGPGKRQAGGVRFGAMAGSIASVTLGPVGHLLGNQFGERLVPAFDQPAVGLEMELDAVDGAADAEGLVLGHGTRSQMRRPWRQAEGVEVPVEERRPLAQRRKHRVAASGRGRLHLVPAEFDGAAEDVLGAVAAGDKLGAQADAEHRLVGLAEGAGQRRHLGQVGVLVVVDGALLAAKHDQPVIAIGATGQRAALPDAAQVGFDAGFGQRGADLAERRSGEVFDDQCTHFTIHFQDLVAWPARPNERARQRTRWMRLGESHTPEGMRLYAVGDVHGCDGLLAEAHEAIARDLGERPVTDHRIIHIGDYTDRGADSAAVIARLAEMTEADRRVICLKGNHDEFFAGFLVEPEEYGPGWLANGGDATLRSYGVTPSRSFWGGIDYRDLSRRLADALPPAHRAFVAGLPLTARLGDYLFVHAGIRPGVPLDAQDPEDLIWIREEFLWDGRDHGFVVIHGHTPANPPEVMPNRINVDTGAVYGGPLTCLALEGTAYRFL